MYSSGRGEAERKEFREKHPLRRAWRGRPRPPGRVSDVQHFTGHLISSQPQCVSEFESLIRFDLYQRPGKLPSKLAAPPPNEGAAKAILFE